VTRLEEFLSLTSAMHRHLCPRQVLGVRSGMAAAALFGLDLPQEDKRLFAFVETDGCFVDGVSVSTGCSLGHRTLRLYDYGKVAVTVADTATGTAFRITPHRMAREKALEYAPESSTHWHAQLLAYQVMPASELLHIEPVELRVSLDQIVSKPGVRVTCSMCCEEVMNERHLLVGGQPVCLACATTEVYFRPTVSSASAGVRPEI